MPGHLKAPPWPSWGPSPGLEDILGIFWSLSKKWPQHMPPPRPNLVEKGPFQLHRTCQKVHEQMPEHLEAPPLLGPIHTSSRVYFRNCLGNVSTILGNVSSIQRLVMSLGQCVYTKISDVVKY